MSNNTIAFTPTHVGMKTEILSVMVALAASHLFHHKVLIIDAGTNGKATNTLSKTFGRTCYAHNMGDLIDGVPVENVIESLSPYLDVIAGVNNLNDLLKDKKLDGFDDFTILRKLFEPIYKNYDYVLIVPADRSGFASTNAIMAVDNIVLGNDSKPNANHTTMRFINNYLQRFYDNFEAATFDIIGIIPVEFYVFGVYKGAYKKMIEQFGHENVYFEVVKNHNRFEKFTATGVTLDGYHDKRMISLAADVFTETRDRINYLSEHGDVAGFSYVPTWYDFVNGRLLDLGKRVKNYDFVKQGSLPERQH